MTAKPSLSRFILTLFALHAFLSGAAIGSELCDAIRERDVENVKTVLSQSPSQVDERDKAGYTPIYWAARVDSIEIAKLLIEQKANVNAANVVLSSERGLTALHAAESLEMARLLLEHGARIDAKGFEGMTPLMSAAQRKKRAVAKVLVEAGADVDFESAVKLGWVDRVSVMLKENPSLAKRPSFPLHEAASNGDLAMTRLLLDHGAEVNDGLNGMMLWREMTALTHAVLMGHDEVAELLLERGADPMVSGGKYYDYIFPCAVANRNAKLVKKMLEHGANANQPERGIRGESPLHAAAGLGGSDRARDVLRLSRDGAEANPQAVEKVSLLIEYGADVNARSEDGVTPLLIAAFAENRKVVDLLLAKGAKLDIYSACCLGMTNETEVMLAAEPGLLKSDAYPLFRSPLHWAVIGRNAKLVESLLRRGADPNDVVREANYVYGNGHSTHINTHMESPLHTAAHDADSTIVAALVRAGANVNAKDGYGHTPLHIASDLGNNDVVKILLENETAIDAVNDGLATCLHHAAGNGHTVVVETLIAAGANVNAGDKWEQSPLCRAVEHPAIVNRLLDAGANVNGSPKTIKTEPENDGPSERRKDYPTAPLYLAASSGNQDSGKLLIERGAEIDLFSACVFGQLESVRRLLSDRSKLDVNISEDVWNRPIDVAAQSGQLEVVKWLVEQGAKPISADRKQSAVSEAASKGRVHVVEYLSDHVADINQADAYERTPLDEAAFYAHPQMVKFLLERGLKESTKRASLDQALLEACNFDLFGNHHLDRAAAHRDRLEAVRLLIEAGANVNSRHYQGYTPLHLAARECYPRIVELLIERGADVNARNDEDESPLRLASASWDVRYANAEEIEQNLAILIKHGGKK